VNWLWQAHTVENKLKDLGYKTKIVAVKSTGDIILDKPLLSSELPEFSQRHWILP
jgi:porphobilinogen deaminase